ncbi:MAG TPA: T9SS type A sorting domain-containing protein, partial [Candidatus Cloacimonadota bacterium]|nr:T9SS type A sorting domain-containing protein [Candidatus Cloacimonadota bacterium]
PTQGMEFTSTNQTSISFIDTFEPLPVVARSAFIESDYGTVAVIGAGGYDQRSFVFSYALSELVDGSSPTTRTELVNSIMDFFTAEVATLPVTLSSFTVSWANVPLLRWQTSSETQLLGWNVYRGLSSDLTDALKINLLLIPPAEDPSLGASYQYQDPEIPDAEQLFYWLEALSQAGESTFYGHLQISAPLPGDPDFHPTPELVNGIVAIYPNPFTTSLNINLSISEKSLVLLEIYNLKGQKVRTLVEQEIQAGSKIIAWDGRDSRGLEVSDGIYFIKMASPKGNWQKKLVKS